VYGTLEATIKRMSPPTAEMSVSSCQPAAVASPAKSASYTRRGIPMSPVMCAGIENASIPMNQR